MVRKINLKHTLLINLRNGFRQILFEEVYDTLGKIRDCKRDLNNLCWNLEDTIPKKERNNLHIHLDDIKGDPSLSKEEVLRGISNFIENLKKSELDNVSKYVACRKKQHEIAKFLQALEKEIRKSTVMCYDCQHVSTGDLYYIPDLGLYSDVEGMWVCKEHLEWHRQNYLKDHGIDLYEI